MATIKGQFDTQATDLFNVSGTLPTIGTGAGRVSLQIDLTDGSQVAPEEVMIHYSIATATGSTANRGIEFWLARGDENGTAHIDGGLPATETASASISNGFTAAQTRDMLTFLHAVPVAVTTGVTVKGSFKIVDPGRRFSIYIYHELGSTITINYVRRDSKWGYSA